MRVDWTTEVAEGGGGKRAGAVCVCKGQLVGGTC